MTTSSISNSSSISKILVGVIVLLSTNRGSLGWGSDVVNLRAQAQHEAIRKVEEAACQNWLIKTTSERVQQTVEHLLSQVLNSRGYKSTVTQLPPEGSCVKSYV